jgi:hypothetical protein
MGLVGNSWQSYRHLAQRSASLLHLTSTFSVLFGSHTHKSLFMAGLQAISPATRMLSHLAANLIPGRVLSITMYGISLVLMVNSGRLLVTEMLPLFI